MSAETERLALNALRLFYDSHIEDGEPPCPCECCEAARKVYAALLSAAVPESSDDGA